MRELTTIDCVGFCHGPCCHPFGVGGGISTFDEQQLTRRNRSSFGPSQAAELTTESV
ncbi:hypothetical protein RE6C_00124 [Rhodopirellula europaea 6C]|uniref:Uncharacterized protein n=1 Tax=Rhodopirellula europaea 6C TaxID=1263867 RepID=M2APY6_9BACT|nr:hypothetical protein RE6C_00124 [Rhodopirellula europaea 6C]